MNMYDELSKAIQTRRHFVIASHYRPDGDAIGSTLALGLALCALGKQAELWNEDPVPARYAFLPGADLIQPPSPALPDGTDAFICVDTGDLKRIGDTAAARFAEAPYTINIDHHATNSLYADLNAVKAGGAACGFVLYELFKRMRLKPDRAIAEALYVAISTDTGSFQFSSTTPDVMRAAAELMEAGADVGDLNRRLYQEEPLVSFIVKREVMNHASVEEEGKISCYSLSNARKKELGLGLEDTKDLVDIIRVLQGVKVAAIFEEIDGGLVRVSLRSKDPRADVSQIAARFGGGGHSMASGIRMHGGLDECREKVLNAIRAVVRPLS